MRKACIHIIALLLLLGSSSTLLAQDDCYPPKPNRMVVDQVGMLSNEEANALESKLRLLNDKTSNQVVVVALDRLCAGDAAMTAYEIGERWRVGQKEFDNGVVILVKPFGDKGDQHTFIATGYGLEGAIPDATAKLIVDREMIPAFRQNNFYAGLDKAIDVIAELATGEYDHQTYSSRNQGDSLSPLAALFPFIVIVGIWFLLFYRKTSRYARTNNLGFWAALALLNASSRSHRGYYNSFRSGGSSFGGGGGFGGFGGGSFGGGGAGGSW